MIGRIKDKLQKNPIIAVVGIVLIVLLICLLSVGRVSGKIVSIDSYMVSGASFSNPSSKDGSDTYRGTIISHEQIDSINLGHGYVLYLAPHDEPDKARYLTVTLENFWGAKKTVDITHSPSYDDLFFGRSALLDGVSSNGFYLTYRVGNHVVFKVKNGVVEKTLLNINPQNFDVVLMSVWAVTVVIAVIYALFIPKNKNQKLIIILFASACIVLGVIVSITFFPEVSIIKSVIKSPLNYICYVVTTVVGWIMVYRFISAKTTTSTKKRLWCLLLFPIVSIIFWVMVGLISSLVGGSVADSAEVQTGETAELIVKLILALLWIIAVIGTTAFLLCVPRESKLRKKVSLIVLSATGIGAANIFKLYGILSKFIFDPLKYCMTVLILLVFMAVLWASVYERSKRDNVRSDKKNI